MISDTLFEATKEIESYMQTEARHFSDAEQAMIEAVCEHMGAVRSYLDKPRFVSGTERETTTANVS